MNFIYGIIGLGIFFIFMIVIIILSNRAARKGGFSHKK